MLNAKKSITAVFSAMTLTIASLGTSITAFADETETTTVTNDMEVTTSITETVTDTENTVTSSILDIQIDEEDMHKILDELQHGDYKIQTVESDYYSDDYYDTDGNATLIKHEKIICDSEEMQFIAVTTKDGNVFYILINYSADGDEDNVFFLNKVDDFDLYSLLYAGNESEEGQNPQERAEAYANAALVNSSAIVSESETDAPDETEQDEDMSNNNQTGSTNNSMLIVCGVGVLAVIGGAVYLMKSGKLGKKKNTKVEDFDEDYDDEYGEIADDDE